MKDDIEAPPPPPPADVQGTAPTGAVAATATCCPTVSTFEGSLVRSRIQGFDPRTNIVPVGSGDEYWNKQPPGDAPDDPMKRDGARWCSVAVGGTIELEISFDGQQGGGCIANCTFEPSKAGVVSIETRQVAASGVPFKLKGLAEGETSIRVVCEGEHLGWVHVVCLKQLTIYATIAEIWTDATASLAVDQGALSDMLNFIMGQAQIKVVVTAAPPVDLRGNTAVAALEAPMYVSDAYGGYFDAAVGFSGNSSPFFKGLTTFLPPVRRGVVPLYTYVPLSVPSARYGAVPEVGFGPAFAFYCDSDMPGLLYTFGHEMGHVFGLEHPATAPVSQLPAHLTASVGGPIHAQDATNTEIAISPGLISSEGITLGTFNVMGLDPLNVMGYWVTPREQLYLRKDQWISARKGAKRHGAK